MDVVNFAHGEFLMAPMYATFGLAVFAALDPLIASPLVAVAMFGFGGSFILASCVSPCARRPTSEWCRSSRPSGSRS